MYKYLLILLIFASTANFAQNQLNNDSISKSKPDQTNIYYYYALHYLSTKPDSAIYYCNKALEIIHKDSILLKIDLYLSLSEAYYFLDDIKNAENYCIEAEKLAKPTKNKSYLSRIYTNYGILNRYKNKFNKALEYYNKAMELKLEIGDTKNLNVLYTNIGVLNEYIGEYTKALAYYKKSQIFEEQREWFEQLSTSYINLGGIFTILKKYDSAEIYLNKSIQIADSLNLLIDKEYDFELLSDLYEKKGETKQALNYFKKLDSLKYERLNSERSAEQQKLAAQFQNKLKIEQINRLNAEKKNQKYTIYGLSLIILLIIGVIILIFIANNKIKIVNQNLIQKNEEILSQKAEIEAQRDDIQDKSKIINKQYLKLENQNKEIEKQNEDLVSSMRYAKTIQKAAFPDFSKSVSNYFSDNFLLFKPREEVSGDFYWISEQKNKIYLAVADCTGHGIPGALLSIFGISALNNILENKHSLSSNEILLELRKRIILELHQNTQSKTGVQSIDISLIIYDKAKNELQYSGAYNSLFLVRDKKLTEYHSNKIPIGQSRHKTIDYTQNIIQLSKNDSIYLFTDGFQDQLSEITKRKFLKKKFRELIQEISSYELTEQKNLLELILEEWKGEMTQVDDITIVGLKI